MKILNRKAFKQAALNAAESERPAWSPTRVSDDFAEKAESMLRIWMFSEIRRMPSIGKTIK